MALRATGLGAHIRYAQYTCYHCGKVFEGSMDSRYRRIVQGGGVHQHVFFCKWSCMDKHDKKYAAEAEERKLKKAEDLRERWRMRREGLPVPPPKSKPRARPRPQPSVKHMTPKTVEEMRAKVEYYIKAANDAPRGSVERRLALQGMHKWQKRIRSKEECTRN